MASRDSDSTAVDDGAADSVGEDGGEKLSICKHDMEIFRRNDE